MHVVNQSQFLGRECDEALFQGRMLAVWTLAANLPNSGLNFAVDFFLLLFSKEKGTKKSTKKSPAKFTRDFVRKNSPRISAEAFSWHLSVKKGFVSEKGGGNSVNEGLVRISTGKAIQ